MLPPIVKLFTSDGATFPQSVETPVKGYAFPLPADLGNNCFIDLTYAADGTPVVARGNLDWVSPGSRVWATSFTPDAQAPDGDAILQAYITDTQDPPNVTCIDTVFVKIGNGG